MVIPQHILAVLPPMGQSTTVAAERIAQDTIQGSMPMRRPVRRPPVTRTEADRTRLTAIATHPSTRQKPVWRARIILALGDGCGPTATLRRTGPSRSTPIPVPPSGAGGTATAPRVWMVSCGTPPGQPPVPAATVRAIIDRAMAPPPPHRSHPDPRFLTWVGPWPPRSGASPSPPSRPSCAAMV